MNGKTFFCIVSLATALIFGPSGAVFAASQLTLSSSGSSNYVLQGTSMEGVAAMDLTLVYDAVALANPRISKGSLISGALASINTSTPGIVRIGVISTTPIQGSGNIATLSFDARGNSAVGPLRLDARLTSADLKPLPVNIRVINPTNPGTVASDQPPRAEGSKSSSSEPSPTSGNRLASAPFPRGGVDLLQGEESRKGNDTVQGENNSASATDDAHAKPLSEPKITGQMSDHKVDQPKKSLEKGIHSVTSVLKHFKDYSGARSPQSLIALFEQGRPGWLLQSPTIALADGQSTVEITVDSGQAKDIPQVLGIVGVQLVSMEPSTNDHNWTLKLLPGRGVHEATLVVSMGKMLVDLPVVVAPELNIDLDRSGLVTEADFEIFLRKDVAFDLNGDGMQDYLDDYLFTANYLAARQGAKTAAPRVKAGRTETGRAEPLG